jgi:hypothetical protein
MGSGLHRARRVAEVLVPIFCMLSLPLGSAFSRASAMGTALSPKSKLLFPKEHLAPISPDAPQPQEIGAVRHNTTAKRTPFRHSDTEIRTQRFVGSNVSNDLGESGAGGSGRRGVGKNFRGLGRHFRSTRRTLVVSGQLFLGNAESTIIRSHSVSMSRVRNLISRSRASWPSAR